MGFPNGRRLADDAVDQDAATGTFSAAWDGHTMSGAGAPRGLYFARYTVGGQMMDTKRILLQEGSRQRF